MPKFLIRLIMLIMFAGLASAQEDAAVTERDSELVAATSDDADTVTAADEEEGEVEEDTEDEDIDDADLDLQTYDEDEDGFIPTEEIPVDVAIAFPTNI